MDVTQDHPKYDALVRAGLVDDPSRLRELQVAEKTAVVKKPKK